MLWSIEWFAKQKAGILQKKTNKRNCMYMKSAVKFSMELWVFKNVKKSKWMI